MNTDRTVGEPDSYTIDPGQTHEHRVGYVSLSQRNNPSAVRMPRAALKRGDAVTAPWRDVGVVPRGVELVMQAEI